MDRGFDIDDRVICRESGVIGQVLKFYKPTACKEQTLVKTDDGHEYHAPTKTWVKTTEAGNITIKLPTLTEQEVMCSIQQYNGMRLIMRKVVNCDE